MASAFHTISQQLYRETSWDHMQSTAQHASETGVPVEPEEPTSLPSAALTGTSWLAQQRGALADALWFARK